MSAARQDKLMKIAEILKRPGFNPAGAAALEEYVNPSSEQSALNVGWLQRRGQASGAVMITGNRYFPHLPDVSYPLLAKFQ